MIRNGDYHTRRFIKRLDLKARYSEGKCIPSRTALGSSTRAGASCEAGNSAMKELRSVDMLTSRVSKTKLSAWSL